MNARERKTAARAARLDARSVEVQAGTYTVAQLMALAMCAMEGTMARTQLSDPRAGAQYIRAWIGAETSEVFAVLFLDGRHRVVGKEIMFTGTIDGASVHPREVVKAALSYNAAACVVAHNHPSGVAEPSAADITLTRRLADSLALVDIRLLDHFVIGCGEPVSLASRGLM